MPRTHVIIISFYRCSSFFVITGLPRELEKEKGNINKRECQHLLQFTTTPYNQDTVCHGLLIRLVLSALITHSCVHCSQLDIIPILYLSIPLRYTRDTIQPTYNRPSQEIILFFFMKVRMARIWNTPNRMTMSTVMELVIPMREWVDSREREEKKKKRERERERERERISQLPSVSSTHTHKHIHL